MIAETIGCLDDERVVDYRSLRDAAGLRERGLFVAESRVVVRGLLETGRFRLRSLLLASAARDALSPELERLPPDASVYVASARILAGLAGHRVHQGCLALAERGDPLGMEGPDGLMAWARAGRGRLVVLEGLANPDNVGGVFRNAAGFGADAVLVSPGCADPLSRKAIRVSTGACLRLPYAEAGAWPGDLDALREAGFRLLACTASQAAPPLEAERRDAGPLALVFGGEGQGLSASAESRCDGRVCIRTAPGFDSLNVATASGIALHHFFGGSASCAS